MYHLSHAFQSILVTVHHIYPIIPTYIQTHAYNVLFQSMLWILVSQVLISPRWSCDPPSGHSSVVSFFKSA
uniref:Uncharacterized protein n=1 Tax=Anguilla anguilla TaxID=7936 RepID=A0A0E9Y1K0_ANGAN